MSLIATTGPAAPQVSNAVASTPLWIDVIQPFAQAAAILVVLVCIVRVGSQVTAMGTRAIWSSASSRALLTAIVAVGVLWNLALVFRLLAIGESVVESIVSSVLQLISG